MRFIILTYLLINLVGCSEVSQSTRQNFPGEGLATSSEDILVSNAGEGNFDFKLKLPEGFDLLDGNPAATTTAAGEAKAPILGDSPFIKFECNGTMKGSSLTQINVGLKNLSTGKNYVARFEYICAEGASMKLVNLVSGEKYQLSVHVINSKGVIYQGKSDVFTTASEKIVLKMVRVQKNDTVEVDIVFPSDPTPVAASKITCLFARNEVIGGPAIPAVDAGNLENDIALPAGPGGNCTVSSTGIVPIPYPANNLSMPAPNTANACGSSGVSCDVSLGVLKSVAVFKVEISSKACVKDKADVHYVTLHPGQRAIVKACKVDVDPVPPKPTEFCTDDTIPSGLNIKAMLEKWKLAGKYKTVHCGVLYIGDHLRPGIGGHVAGVTRICYKDLGKSASSKWITGEKPELAAELKTLAANKDIKLVCVGTNIAPPPSIEGSALPIQEIKVVKADAPTPAIVRIVADKVVSVAALPFSSPKPETEITLSFTLQGCLDSLGNVNHRIETRNGKLSIFAGGDNIVNPASALANCFAVPTATYKFRVPGIYLKENITLLQK